MAKTYYSQAIKLNPNNLRALYGLYLVSGKRRDATRLSPMNIYKNGSFSVLQSHNRFEGTSQQTKRSTEIGAVVVDENTNEIC